MRLFVALPVPSALREAVTRATAPLREGGGQESVRWTRPEAWHLTLAFLGATPDDRLAEVRAALDRVAAGTASIDLRSADAGRFGRRVLWLGVDDDPPGAVARLGGLVQSSLADAHLPVQRQPVHPHVTLARAGGRRGHERHDVDEALVARVDAALTAGVPQPVAWRATALELWSSRLGRGPARYAVEHVARLAT
ncbi:RNA 2',3'-cyclic phosphodiesterase [Egicoccus halophilus]|uniref:RNA 2',3'-cyclic phosphodiesterase n=1 Tax=Egicoccus halophilus TaxID=1670830 RepID=A0A8J3AES8_9ACTN|nr:RNA 2',3'-cyclic phosphodiesterase [Egicoccus halophilus]GGI06594.1 RNA 2',3'-cyclic phosphodiesterase [Egicoccus halophilus]